MATNTGLHRFALLTALVALGAIVAGAVVTSIERPLASNAAAASSATVQAWHQIIAGLAVVLAGCLAIWLTVAKTGKRLRQLGSSVLLAAAAGAALGTPSVLRSFLPLSGMAHALLAYLFFANAVIVAVVTSASWQQAPERIQDTWRPSLRSLSVCVPAIVILQILLGAAFRYKIAGVLWHILNAMLVLLLILCVAVFLIRQFPQHPSLRPAAIALAVITSIQVLLGFTTFLMLLLFPESSPAVIITSALHAGTGALTLAASGVLAVQIRHNIA